MSNSGGACVAQSVKCLTLDFSSGHGPTVHEFKPRIWLPADTAEPAWDSLPLPFPPPLAGSLSLSQSQNK